MITFEEGLKIANEYLKDADDTQVESALDAGTCWIFYGEPCIGGAGVKINKETANAEDFILPDEENFELLERAVKIELPQKTAVGKFFLAQD